VDARLHLSQFEDQIRQEAKPCFPAATLSVVERGKYRLKIRIELNTQTFIDIFYNPCNGRTDFALIHNDRRMFGYDNLGGWHRHSLEAPEAHTACDEPSVRQVFQEMRAAFSTMIETSGNRP
jgi:hypothetical protein